MTQAVRVGLARMLLASALLFFVFALAQPDSARAADISGSISVDTAWTAGASPYVLTGDVVLETGVTLTIGPGCTVFGDGHELEVYGDLIVAGTSEDPVVVRDAHVVGRGRYVLPSTVETFSISVVHADIDGGSVQGGVAMYGSWRLSDSIVSNAEDQMYLWFPRAESVVERTVFLNGGKISSGVLYADVSVLDSIFWRAESSSSWRDTAVENWAAYSGSEMHAHGNSFLNAGEIAVKLPDWTTSGALDASSNWWTSTDTAIVESMVFDVNDAIGSPGAIPYEPVLDAPTPTAPHWRLPLSGTAEITSSEPTVVEGETVELIVEVLDSRGAAEFGVPVTLESSPDGVSWTEEGNETTGPDGSATFAAQPPDDMMYRAFSASVAGVYDPAASGTVSVVVEEEVPGPAAVKRIPGRDRYEVAVNAARETKDPAGNRSWPGVKHVIVASGEDRAAADPLAAAGLSWAYGNAPLILVKSTAVPGAAVTAVGEIAEANQTGRETVVVHVVGGELSVPSARLAEMEAGVKAAFGSDAADGLLFDRVLATGSRYDLARAIALRMKTVRGAEMPSRALIANGADSDKFFDALALSAVSARTGAPVLLVTANGIPTQTTRTLSDLSIGAANRYIAGGPNTVSDAVAKSLGVSTANRWYGRTRYATAKAVAEAAVAKGWLQTTCTGVSAKLADALTGGSMTGGVGGALVITSSAPLQGECDDWLRSRKGTLDQVWVFGGTISVTPATYNEIVAAVQ